MANPLKHQLDVEGYCVVEGFLPPADVDRLRQATRRYPQQLRDSTPAGWQVSWDRHGGIQQIYHAETLSPDLDAINRSDRALSLLHRVYGYDIGLYHSKFILKDPGGSAVPWHQDFSYWRRRSDHPCQINCMVYLDDADEDNGCLRVVPRSHLDGLQPHHDTSSHGAFSSALDGRGESRAVPVPGQAGTAVLFGPLLQHASGANRSSRPRHSFTTVYTNPVIDAHREVFGTLFAEARVKALTGPGPFRFCSPHYQRRSLWQLAVDHVADPRLPWIEITDRTWNDGSFEWLSGRKPLGASYARYEELPLVTSNRDDVRVRAGRLTETLDAVDGPVGLLFLDCARLAGGRAAWKAYAPNLRPGTVIVLDHFYDTPDRDVTTRRLFEQFIVESGLGFDYLGRAPQQVAVRLIDGPAGGCPELDWQPASTGIRYG